MPTNFSWTDFDGRADSPHSTGGVLETAWLWNIADRELPDAAAHPGICRRYLLKPSAKRLEPAKIRIGAS
jgi:hypothetical protein